MLRKVSNYSSDLQGASKSLINELFDRQYNTTCNKQVRWLTITHCDSKILDSEKI